MGWVLVGDRFTVRKVRHQGGSLSYWVFTPDAEVHRPSLNVLKRYGTSSQQTYAYGLADHLNWARVNGKTPETVTPEDLQRYMNGVTDRADGVHGIAWRKPQQTPLGASAAGNVATVVKAYYLTLSTSQPVNPDLVEALAADGGAVGSAGPGGRSGRIRWHRAGVRVDRGSCQTRWWRRCFSRGC